MKEKYEKISRDLMQILKNPFYSIHPNDKQVIYDAANAIDELQSRMDDADKLINDMAGMISLHRLGRIEK